MNLNNVIISGRVSQVPELRSTSGGQSVATMGVATNRTWTDKQGNRQESAEFHTVVIWGKTAETASTYLQKGSLVLVEGHLETRTWEDRDGVARRVTEIIAEDVQFGPKPTAQPTPATKRREEPSYTVIPDDREPLPRLNDEEESGSGFTPAFAVENEDEEQSDVPF